MEKCKTYKIFASKSGIHTVTHDHLYGALQEMNAERHEGVNKCQQYTILIQLNL